MTDHDFNLTPEQQELLTDLVEFYNSHDVTIVSFGHSRRFGTWSGSYVSFTLETDRSVLFRFSRELVTPAFEECLCYLAHQNKTALFPSEGGSQNSFVWRKWKYD